MEDFSTADRIRAFIAPLACCIPTFHLLPAFPSADSLNNNNSREWYDQSRPTDEALLHGNWEAAEARSQRRDADLLSLHENDLQDSRRRRRGRGGDVSGGGADPGSGLSRLTLMRTIWRSWWAGEGAVRLPDSDDEDHVGERDGRAMTDDEEGDRTQEDSYLYELSPEDADARAISVVRLPSPPSSEATTAMTAPERHETNGEREARRARRRAKRRARELGLSVSQFDEGAVAEPTELSSPSLAPPTSARSRSREGSRASSSGSGSTSHEFVLIDTSVAQLSNGSHGFNFSSALSPRSPALAPVVEDEAMDGGDELFSAPKKSSRRKDGDGSSHRSGSSSQSRSRSAHSASHEAPNSSPATSTTCESPHESKRPRPRHRSHPSLSSTSSSGKHRTKKTRHIHLDQSEASEGNYYQDENGQLQPVPQTLKNQPVKGQWFINESGQHVLLSNEQIYQHQHQQQQQSSPYPSPLDFSQPRNYDLLPASRHALPEEVEEIDSALSPSSTATPPLSSQTDTTAFLKALKATKRPAATIPTQIPAHAEAAEEEGGLLDQWEGLVKRPTWEGASEVEGLEDHGWKGITKVSDSDETPTDEDDP